MHSKKSLEEEFGIKLSVPVKPSPKEEADQNHSYHIEHENHSITDTLSSTNAALPAINGFSNPELAENEKERLQAVTQRPHQVIYREQRFYVEPIVQMSQPQTSSKLPQQPNQVASSSNALPETSKSPSPKEGTSDVDILPNTVQPDPKVISELKRPINKKFREPRFKLKQCFRSQFEKLFLCVVMSLIATFPVGTVNLMFSQQELAQLPDWITVDGIALFLKYLSFGLIAYMLFKVMLARLLHTYWVDEDDIEANNAFFARDIEQTLMSNIKNIKLKQGVIGRALGFGTLEFFTAGSGKVDVTFENIRAPEVVYAVIEDRLRRSRKIGDKFSD